MVSKQKRPVRDIKDFARNVSIEIRFCFCRMILSLTATVTKLSNKHIHFLVIKRQETGDYRSTKGQNLHVFQSWAEQLQNTSVRKRCWSTWMVGMSRHGCGKYRTWASEVLLLTLFATQIFDHTLGFFLPPCQIAPSCFTLFSLKIDLPKQDLFSWYGSCHLPIQWI